MAIKKVDMALEQEGVSLNNSEKTWNDANIIIVLNRETNGEYDRIIYDKDSKQFIYGTDKEYIVYIGEEEEEQIDYSKEQQENIRYSYNLGITASGSSFYDENGKVYEVVDTAKPHKLIFDINKAI